MDTETITKLFKEDPRDWQKKVLQQSGKEFKQDDLLSLEKINEYHTENTKGLSENQLVSMESIIGFSKEMESVCDSYQHNQY